MGDKTMERLLDKPKTQSGRRYVESRLPKIHEDVKKTLFLRGGNANALVTELLKEFYALCKPNAVLFKKKNATRPFDDSSKIEFFCKKEDTAFFVFGSSSKKRPNALTIGRIFDDHVMEMYELSVSRFASLFAYSPRERVAAGLRASVVFLGDAFEFDVELKAFRNVLVDMFGGSSLAQIQVESLAHVLVFAVGDKHDKSKSGSSKSSNGDAKQSTGVRRIIQCRTYRVYQKKSGSNPPRCELEEMGPSFEFELGRALLPNAETWKRAIQQPKESKPKTTKNVDMDVFGSKVGRIHVPKQDLANLHVRKVRALRNDPQAGGPAKRKRLNASKQAANGDDSSHTPMDAD